MDVYAQTGIADVPTLTTDRLTLRTFTRADCGAVVDALNNWEVTRWLTNVPFPYTSTDFDWFLTNLCVDAHKPVWVMDMGQGIIGTISHGSELGYWLASDYHGKGLMTEAAKAVCAHHFGQTDAALQSGYHKGNAPSAHVLAKLGFVDTHIDNDVITARNETVDIQRMTLTKDAWRARYD